ncbi:MAG: dihydropteroate synthase [Paludibacteraceae bacterium]|nr:dihydropteroate synthase [Paludibacteraceae bacterium]
MNNCLRLGNRLLSLKSPLVMAIVNATPDSFFAASRADSEAALQTAFERVLNEGAHMMDIGACSTRPAVQAGAGVVDEQQEWMRLDKALAVATRMNIALPVSVDTFRVNVARRALEEYGVAMINDVSGGSDEMFDLVAHYNAAYVLTYNRARVGQLTENVLADALAFFSREVDDLRRRGVSDIVIDPGFGFGQTVEQSLDLLANLGALRHLGCPILAGISRKRMAYQPSGLTPETCLEQTLFLEQQALNQGASILRVHDVAATIISLARK